MAARAKRAAGGRESSKGPDVLEVRRSFDGIEYRSAPPLIPDTHDRIDIVRRYQDGSEAIVNIHFSIPQVLAK